MGDVGSAARSRSGSRRRETLLLLVLLRVERTRTRRRREEDDIAVVRTKPEEFTEEERKFISEYFAGVMITRPASMARNLLLKPDAYFDGKAIFKQTRVS